MSPPEMQSRPVLSFLFVNSIQMFAGGEIWMLRTLTALRERGHRTGIVCRPGTELEKRARDLNIPTFPQPFRGDLDPLSILRMARTIKSFRPDVILTNMDKELRIAGIASRFFAAPVLIPRRGIDYPLKNHLLYRLSYQKWAHGIIANSQATKRTLLKNAPFLRPEKIRVIYNGVKLNQFFPRSQFWRKQLGLSSERFIFGFSGQLDERKGLRYLLPAFAEVVQRHPEAVLLLAGEGNLRPEIETFIQKRQLDRHVFLLGFIENIPEFMAGIDALVLPSLWEGFGIVLIEAMAAGKPVITTTASNLPEIVEDGVNGLLVPPGNSEALREALIRIMQDAVLGEQLGRRGRQIVEKRFSLDQVTEELETYCLERIREKRKRL